MKILFWFGVAFTLVAPVVIGVCFGDSSTSWVAALCGAFITFISKLHEIAELSLGPVKARMRETIDEASATISQLKKIAVANSEATLSDLIGGSFMGGMSQSKRLEIHDNVISALTEIGVEQSDLEFVERDWKKGIAIIYMRAIKAAVEGRTVKNQINTEISEPQKQALKELDILSDFDSWTSPEPNQVKKILTEYNIESDEVEFWLSDYEYFTQHNHIRHKDRFVDA